MKMSFFITIDGKRVQAHEGEMVLQVARRAGIEIPTLCVHDAVEPFGACRLCMVEVTKPQWDGWKGLMTACLYPAAPDLQVETGSARVREVRRTVLDLLLARCPGSQVIRELAARHGVEQTSFAERPAADLCILCGLCVRVCEKAATAAITTVNRGHRREVGTPFGDPPPDCIGCLACAHVCPTGHITFTEAGLTRTIWGRAFELARCGGCGGPLPITAAQATFLARQRPLDPSYFSRCPDCQRRRAAATLGAIAGWSKLGMAQAAPLPTPAHKEVRR